MEWPKGKLEDQKALKDFDYNRNSSALPNFNVLDETSGNSGVTGKKESRKNSVLLPNGNSIIDSKGAALQGGVDNYKRY